jgi:hypothetical protein
MSTRDPYALAIRLVALAVLAGCGSPHDSLIVGDDDAGFGSFDNANAPDALAAHIEENRIAVTFVTLSCSKSCATVQAVATGGHPPYSFAWDDGPTGATRTVCPTSTRSYALTVTDTGLTGDLVRPSATADASLTANVIACPEAGAPVDAGGPSAPPVYWATWDGFTAGTPGAGQGHLSPPGGDVQIAYSGEVGAGSAKTGDTTLSGVGQVTFLPASTYESATVPNAPPPTGMMTVWGSPTLTQKVEFSVPVRGVLIAFVALNETWSLSASPTLLSSGPNTLLNVLGAMNAPTLSGNTMSGVDANGVIEIPGVVSSVSFTVPMYVTGDFTSFTVGIRGRN